MFYLGRYNTILVSSYVGSRMFLHTLFVHPLSLSKKDKSAINPVSI